MGRPNDDNDDPRRASDSDRPHIRRLEDVGHDATLADSSASQPGRGAFASAATSAEELASGPTHTPGALRGMPEKDLGAGDQVGEYVVEAQIGRGGFGTVYRAVQPLIGKRVAIKVLSRKYSADSEIVSRFVAEARAVNQIRHRHIIDIFSFGQLADGRHYYVMELLEGDPLDHYLAVRGPLPIEQALPILRSIARALDAAHAKGIAHRDLKPENIFIAQDTDGQGTEVWPKLLDFGIAKLMGPDDALSHKTGTGVPIGTPYYMSPEQCRGRDVDHRTDIYSFGILTYRMLTGTYPFEGEVVEILHKQMHETAEPASKRNPGLSPEVDQALEWMMQKDPEQRPRSVIAAVVALQDDKTPTPMLTSSAVRDPVKPVRAIGTAPRRRSMWLIPAFAALLIGGGMAAFVAVRADRSPPDKPVAAAPVAKPAVAPPT
nr:serine/threonine protein kinase [Myxococcota bacterium]